MRRTICLFLFIVVSLFCFGFKGCSSKETGLFTGTIPGEYTLKTPRGATVTAGRRIDPAVGPLVDGGIDDVNRIASEPPNNYDVSDIGHNRYRVALFPKSEKCIEPGFLIDTSGDPGAVAAYDGSIYDKNPTAGKVSVCAAGLTVMWGAYGQPQNPGMLIVDDMAITRLIVRYEAEHNILFIKDPPRYNATQYHTNGNGHPILGDGAPVQAKVVPEQAPTDADSRSGPLSPRPRFRDAEFTAPEDFEPVSGFFVRKGDKVCVLLTR